MSLLTLLAIGCVEAPADLADLPIADGWPAVLPPPTLTLTVDRLRVGQPAAFLVEGGTSGDTLRIGMSYGAPAAGDCPPSLGGECLGLAAPVQVVGRMRVRGGLAEHTITAPDRPDTDLCFQAASPTYDQVSNVVCRTIQAENVSRPGPYESQDVWTTSVYSYAPGGGGPGGGLDNDVLRIGGWGDEYRALVKFDLDGLPASASHAEVRLWNNQDGGVGGPGVLVDYLTSPWDWRTSGSGSDHERLWWADRPSSTPLAGPLGAVPAGSWLVLDVTALYNQWQTGALVNEGLQLRPTSTSNRFSHFLSSENAVDVALRPVLEVTP